MPSHTHTAIAAPAPPTRALARLVSSSQGMAGLAWHGMVWLGVRSRYFHNEVRWYLPTQNLKIQFGTFCQILAAPPSGSREGLRRKFRRGMFHTFALWSNAITHPHCHCSPRPPQKSFILVPTQNLKIQFGTFCQILAAPPSGSREGLRRKFRRGMFHTFAKKFHFGTPHLLDFQVAAWW